MNVFYIFTLKNRIIKLDIATIKKDRTTDDKKMNAATAALKSEQGKLET